MLLYTDMSIYISKIHGLNSICITTTQYISYLCQETQKSVLYKEVTSYASLSHFYVFVYIQRNID